MNVTDIQRVQTKDKYTAALSSLQHKSLKRKSMQQSDKGDGPPTKRQKTSTTDSINSRIKRYQIDGLNFDEMEKIAISRSYDTIESDEKRRNLEEMTMTDKKSMKKEEYLKKHAKEMQVIYQQGCDFDEDLGWNDNHNRNNKKNKDLDDDEDPYAGPTRDIFECKKCDTTFCITMDEWIQHQLICTDDNVEKEKKQDENDEEDADIDMDITQNNDDNKDVNNEDEDDDIKIKK